MRYLRIAGLLAVCLLFASFANAQRVAVGVGFGGPVYAGYGYGYAPAPVCAYGYYGYGGPVGPTYYWGEP